MARRPGRICRLPESRVVQIQRADGRVVGAVVRHVRARAVGEAADHEFAVYEWRGEVVVVGLLAESMSK